VALIGDSIRLGYQPYTSLYLLDRVKLWGPEESCGNTYNILENAFRWLDVQEIDIYHINAGHHDLMCVPYNSRRNLVDIDDYVSNVQRIIKYIHTSNSKALIIWATSTPVNTDKVNEFIEYNDGNGIYNEDIIRYNEAALKEVNRLGVPVNDLYSFVMDGDPDRIMLEDGIHFNETGSQFLGEQVANAIEVFL
jgi:lysophospholipase L1-like esterase